MIVEVFESEKSLGERAAEIMAAQLKEKPDSVLGLATGSSPLPLYQALVEMYQRGEVDFKDAASFNLDEYVGLDRDNPQSYYYFMQDNLFKYVNMPQERIHVPYGMAENIEEELRAYDKAIEEAGGIDIQVLGIGGNGHIAFNEPAESFSRGTGIIDLTEDTINANKRFFESADQVPRQALSMGIKNIMHARKIILIATGEAKAKAVYQMINGVIAPSCPATALQMHQNVIVLLDQAAAKLL